MFRSLAAAVLPLLLALPAVAQPARPAKPTPAATPAEQIKALKDFKVELLYSVPKDKQGSWVSMCVDPRGRLIVSDQYGGLFRITPPPVGKSGPTQVEKIDVPIGEAQGLLWAFDSLYVVVNKGRKYESGLYRVRDTDGDDKLDKVELLRKISGGGEHGPHAVLLAPDGKSLYVVCGDGTKMMAPLSGSRVPQIWGEDHLLPRMPDGNGFMKGVLGPGGFMCKVDPDGKNWELISVGYRNQYDAAFNRHGELLTFDADMEWDMNTPWYRPTRVCLATSGSEFGWRNGAGKWPPYYPDSLPAVFNVGPGSPTGVTFGYGAKFPAKYQEAFFICDWSYGKLYALHLTPEMSAYRGEIEEFVTGSPLPLTDIVINPVDGAMYFAVGGRQTQSGLYRVTYVGKEPTEPAPEDKRGAEFRALRHKLEAFHGRQDPKAVDAAWPYLSHPDRYIRFAARTAIEWQDVKEWDARALEEREPAKALAALLALVRVTGKDPFHHPQAPPPPAALKSRILDALARLDWDKLTDTQRLELLRIYEVLFNRMGPPDAQTKARLGARLDAVYPARAREVNAELCQVLVYLEAPHVVTKTLKLLADAPTQEEQLEYARYLRVLKTGWTLPQRKEYFNWFRKAAHFKGGASIRGFLRIMKTDAVATLTPEEKAELKPILEARPLEATPIVGKPRPVVKQWKLDEVVAVVDKGMKSRRDFDRGRRLFGEAQCFACHRFDGEGGSMGPDLTGAAGRFSARDLLESIVEPSKVISDQYAAVEITTTDGKVVVGRIVNLNGDNVSVNTNMLDPNALTNVRRSKVESMAPSKVSMMPTGLLDTFHEDEVADLAAFLLSRGDRNNKVYTTAPEGQEKKTEAAREGKRETIHLFNGKDLEGWEGHKKYWSVQDGVIVGKNTEPVPVSTYLLTKRKFRDFRLVFDFKLAKSEMHSGIAMWGRVAPEHGDPYTYAGHLVMFPSGYGFYDLYGRNLIHNNAEKARKVGKQHDWNHIEILAQGDRIRFVLNGVLISDWREPMPGRIKEGPLGLQLHSNKVPQEVQFKGLVLETNPEDKLTTLKEEK